MHFRAISIFAALVIECALLRLAKGSQGEGWTPLPIPFIIQEEEVVTISEDIG